MGPTVSTPHLILLLLLLLLLQPTSTSAYRFINNANFGYCWVHNVSWRDPFNYSDGTQYFAWDSSHNYRISTSRPLLNLRGCEQLCHDGYQLWPATDTLQRLTIWLLPSCILLAHFHFAPLGAAGRVFVLLHVLGDPVDSMWSMLARQEAARRHYTRATKNFGNGVSKAVATIWYTYDELGWQDPSEFFLQALRQRALQQHQHQADSLPHPPPPRAQVRALDDTEAFHLEAASHRLASLRSEARIETWIAILGLLFSLGGAYVRTWSDKLNSQTAHTVAVACLLFILVPLVKVSGNVGSFLTRADPVAVIDDLREKLARHARELHPGGEAEVAPLLPPLIFIPGGRWDPATWGQGHDAAAAAATERVPIPCSEEEAVGVEDGDNMEDTRITQYAVWDTVAPWAGMCSSWRPCKTLRPVSSDDRGNGQLGTFSYAFVIAAFGAAFMLSFYTPTIGLGCRSLGWTVIALTWTASQLGDCALRSRFAQARTLWAFTCIKDALAAGVVISIIVTAQLGLMNNCYCRAAVYSRGSNAYVDVGPQSDQDFNSGWLLWLSAPAAAFTAMMALIWMLGHGSEQGRQLLSRSQCELHATLVALRRSEIALGLVVPAPLATEEEDEVPRNEDGEGGDGEEEGEDEDKVAREGNGLLRRDTLRPHAQDPEVVLSENKKQLLAARATRTPLTANASADGGGSGSGGETDGFELAELLESDSTLVDKI